MKSFGSFTSEKGRTITFREPSQEDVTSLLEFANALIHEDLYIQLGGSQSGKPLALMEEQQYVDRIVGELEKREGVHILAFHESTLVGNAGVTKGRNRREHVGSLGIALHEDYRGEGIGRKLIEILLHQVKSIGIQMVELKVYHPNLQAIGLYQKMGFQEIGRFPNSGRYKDGFIDEVWMYKIL